MVANPYARLVAVPLVVRSVCASADTRVMACAFWHPRTMAARVAVRRATA
jgi:hypothetical protein